MGNVKEKESEELMLPIYVVTPTNGFHGNLYQVIEGLDDKYYLMSSNGYVQTIGGFDSIEDLLNYGEFIRVDADVVVSNNVQETPKIEEDLKTNKRSNHYIGEGEYLVAYKCDHGFETMYFRGVCENFNSSGKSAFWNDEKQQMLVIGYNNIIGIYPIEDRRENK